MTSVEGNVIEAILKCIRMVSEKQERLEAGGAEASGVRETLEDVRIELCRLASLLVTAPITGRMFLPLPGAYVSAEDAQKSLRSQLGLEGGRFTHK